MIYIMSAFESEARSLIDLYNLPKQDASAFKIFCDKEMLVIISGMGQEKASAAIQYLLLNYPNKKDDIFINLGICSGQAHYKVGELLQIKQLKNKYESHILSVVPSSIKEVSCFSATTPLNRPSATDIAEMQAMSIYKIIREYFRPKNISFLKIVSDNFQPVKPTKQFIKDLTHKNMPFIQKHIQDLSKA